MKKKAILLASAFMLLWFGFGMKPVLAEQISVKDAIPEQSVLPETDDDRSPEEIFSGYVDLRFNSNHSSKKKLLKKNSTIPLTGNDLAIYNNITEKIQAILNGTRTSTIFEISGEDMGLTKNSWTQDELGVTAVIAEDEEGNAYIPEEATAAIGEIVNYDLDKIIDTLLANHPYELYWFDKTKDVNGVPFTLSAEGDVGTGEGTISLNKPMQIKFCVAQEFAADEEYQVAPDVGETVTKSVNNAAAILSKYSSASDLEKLQAYKNEICSLVSYNDNAISDNADYGNPWQMLWVFDDDPTTNVVCEGYAKAFKYLCDQSTFTSDTIDCILVLGTMIGGEGAGDHMWNMVKMEDNNNYLVDVTNCDEDTIGESDKLFLAGTDDQTTDANGTLGYSFGISGYTIAYQYDESTRRIFEDKDLQICTKEYAKWEYADETNHQRVSQGAGSHVEIAPHSWDDGRFTKEPSRGVFGEKVYTCSICNGTKTEIVKATVESVTKQIEDLPDSVDLRDEEEVKDARTAYNYLDDSQKALVSADLVEALDQAEVDIVVKKMEAIADAASLSLNDKTAVANARKAYNSLTDKQKAQVSSDLLDALTAAEEKISALEEKAKPVKASAVKISGMSNKIAIKKKIKLTATVLPANTTNKKVIWKSSNPKLISVNQNGLVTVGKKAAGKTVVITAVAADGSGKKATWKIKGMKGAVKKITLKGAKKVKAGKSTKLKAKVKASKGANKKLIWTSSNKNYATVNSKGKVKTYTAGKGETVKITVMATDGSGKKKAINIKIK